MTNEDVEADDTLACWNAVRRDACAACLDVADDGSCGLQDRLCAVAGQLPLVIAAVRRVRRPQMDEYVQAIEDDVCRRCHESDSQGRCRLRDRGRCALYANLPFIVDAIDEVSAPAHN